MDRIVHDAVRHSIMTAGGLLFVFAESKEPVSKHRIENDCESIMGQLTGISA
jgi:hypothetical protein